MSTGHRLSLGVITGALCATACSGGGGGGGNPSGLFLDSAVSGMTTISGTLIDTTDADGRFSYKSGQIVMFSIGDVILGLAQGQAILTPVDLVAGAVDEMDDEVTNIARLLQTVDLDQDPENGIEIDAAVQMAAVGVSIDFSQSIAQFEANEQADVDLLTAGLPGGSRTLIPAMDAQEHLRSTLRSNVAGRYEGSFSGDDSGPFSVFVDREGTIFGWAISSFDGLISLTGSADTDGGFVAGNASTGATFMGQIEPDGNFAGTWQLSIESGTFQGKRNISVDPNLDEDLVEMFAGQYDGTSTSGGVTEAETLFMDDDGNVSLPSPDDRISGTIVSTSGSTAEVVALTDEGCFIEGTLTLPGTIVGTARNDYEGESATFTLTKP